MAGASEAVFLVDGKEIFSARVEAAGRPNWTLM